MGFNITDRGKKDTVGAIDLPPYMYRIQMVLGERNMKKLYIYIHIYTQI